MLYLWIGITVFILKDAVYGREGIVVRPILNGVEATRSAAVDFERMALDLSVGGFSLVLG